MITPSSQRCEPCILQMDALEFLRTAPPLPPALLDGIEKVIRVAMLPFAFIVDLAINTVRVFVNVVISLANYLQGPLTERSPPPCLATSEEIENSLPPLSAVALQDVQLASAILPLPATPTPDEQTAATTQPLALPVGINTAPDSPPPPYALNTSTPTVSNPAPQVPAPQVILPPCTPEEDQNIGQLLNKLVELGLMNSIAVGKELMAIGTSIQNVHPLTFLLLAVKTPDRVKNLKFIFDKTFKRLNFMSYGNGGPSLNEKLSAIAKERDFNPLLAAFTQQAGIRLPFAKQCAQSHEWEKLVFHLVNMKQPKT